MRLSAKTLLLKVFFLALSMSAVAHGGLIKGNVSDSLSNTALVGASVLLGDNQEVTSTDQLGNFRFDGLAAGTYRIRVTYIGYRSRELTVSVRENETIMLKVFMTPSALSLNEVIVSGAATTETAMTTISKIDMALRPVKSSQEILRLIPGGRYRSACRRGKG